MRKYLAIERGPNGHEWCIDICDTVEEANASAQAAWESISPLSQPNYHDFVAYVEDSLDYLNSIEDDPAYGIDYGNYHTLRIDAECFDSSNL